MRFLLLLRAYLRTHPNELQGGMDMTAECDAQMTQISQINKATSGTPVLQKTLKTPGEVLSFEAAAYYSYSCFIRVIRGDSFALQQVV